MHVLTWGVSYITTHVTLFQGVAMWLQHMAGCVEAC